MSAGVLIVGGTRFIGAAVVRRLVRLGHQVTVLHRGRTEAPLPPAVRHLHLEREALESALGRTAPDMVVDMVARTERDGTLAAAALAGRVQRVVVVSSIDVYRAYERLCRTAAGPPDPVPLGEDAPLRVTRHPRRAQARGPDDWRHHYDKLLVEQAYSAEPRLPLTRLRLPFVFGPGDYRRRVQALLERMRCSDEIVLGPREASWRCTRAHVEDVAAVVVLALTHPDAAGRIYNVGEERALSLAEWFRWVGHAAGWGGQVIALGPDPELPDWSQHMVVETTRLRRELGFREEVGLRRGLQQTVSAGLDGSSSAAKTNSDTILPGYARRRVQGSVYKWMPLSRS